MRRSCLFAALITCTVLAHTDDSNWMSVGGAGGFANHKYVGMESEVVKVVIDDDHVRVRATFNFRNYGPATMVTMAFPDETSMNNSPDGKPLGVIREFRSWVDGSSVNVTKQRVSTGEDFHVSAVWLKKVPFRKGQSRVVTVDYIADNGFAGNGWVMNSYIIRTGATWRGKIKRCDLFVDWSKVRNYSRPWLELASRGKRVPPLKWIRTGYRKVRTTLTNIEPYYDLYLTMIRGFWNFNMNGRRMRQNFGATTTDTGFSLTGRPDDIMIAMENVGQFFGQWDGGVKDFGSPEARHFGRSVKLKDSRHLVLGNGETVRLRRPAVTKTNGGGQDFSFVYLRDLIQALGGIIRYDRADERYEIKMPK